MSTLVWMTPTGTVYLAGNQPKTSGPRIVVWMTAFELSRYNKAAFAMIRLAQGYTMDDYHRECWVDVLGDVEAADLLLRASKLNVLIELKVIRDPQGRPAPAKAMPIGWDGRFELFK